MYCNPLQDTSTLSPDINAGNNFDANIPSRPPRERQLANLPDPYFILKEPLSSGLKGKS